MQQLFSTGGSRAANGDYFALRASCWSNPYETLREQTKRSCPMSD
jgi:hypothetical protein